MPHAIQIHNQGAPEVMQWVEVPDLQPGTSEVLLRQTAVGLNYIDVYQRSGGYKLDLPACIGMEGVGIIDAIGDGGPEPLFVDYKAFQSVMNSMIQGAILGEGDPADLVAEAAEELEEYK